VRIEVGEDLFRWESRRVEISPLTVPALGVAKSVNRTNGAIANEEMVLHRQIDTGAVTLPGHDKARSPKKWTTRDLDECLSKRR
jgi:hypothetical protein